MPRLTTDLETSGSSIVDRFEITGRLGTGGMGVVYRAHDHARRIDVALKTLRRLDGAMLYRFKNEFRALAGIVHPNLVTLYELHSVTGNWFFTMELVEGVDFLEYVRPHAHILTRLAAGSSPPGAASAAEDAAASHASTSVVDAITATTVSAVESAPADVGLASLPRRQAVKEAELRVERLRAALPALAEGVWALHRAGKLHRDIKPSNVLVDRNGRVVVCDFGLAVEFTRERDSPAEAGTAGTPLFMSPEQAGNRALSEASDWYSVGVMLFFALTGQPPFAGSAKEIIASKQEAEAPDPRELASDLPEDLSELCRTLLERDAAKRPDGRQVLKALGRKPESIAVPSIAGAASRTPFVGRAAQLAVLGEALARTRTGTSAAVFVHGPSGIGKSALIERFLEEVRTHESSVILRGRCYESESVTFKALDTMVDALAGVLLEMPPEEAERIMPRDFAALSRLFPVLERVSTFGRARTSSVPLSDPQETRQRAFAALRYMLRQLAVERPTVLHIDDLQWGDLDSAQFLFDLIHHPHAPPVLFVGCYRSEEAETSGLLQALLKPETETGISGDLQQLAVEPLRNEEAVRLARHVIGYTAASGERINRIVEEAGGNPFYVAELARAAADPAVDDDASNVSLDDVLARRIAGLPEEANALLTASCVGGRPLPLGLVSRAAEIKDEAAALAALQAGHLVRTRGTGSERFVEPYHDRVRATVTSRLSSRQSRRVHRRLARALESSARTDPLALVELWLGAGDEDRAVHYADLAAATAERALAFDRAAHNYRLVLDLEDLGDHRRRFLLTKLGNALAAAGNLREAAEAYVEAAETAARHDALELRRRALEQLLRAGDFTKGVEIARIVLREVGLGLPSSRVGIVAAIAYGRARLALSGMEFRERPAEERDEEELRRVDVCWSVSSGLTFVDPPLGTAFQSRQLLYALKAGDPYRAAVAFAMEIGFRSLAGSRARAKIEEAARLAREVAEASGDPAASGLAISCEGFARALLGEFRVSQKLLAEGFDLMLHNVSGFRWQLDVAHNYRMFALLYLGRIAELTRQVPILLGEAVERGDEYLASGLRSGRSNMAWLALGDPEEARRQVLEVERKRPLGRHFRLQDYYHVLAHTQIDLYEGDTASAWKRISEAWRPMRKAMLLRIQFVFVDAHFLRIRAGVALAAAQPSLKKQLLREADRSLRAIENENLGWGDALASLGRACVAELRGEREVAVDGFGTAVTKFEAADMALFAAVAAHRKGTLVGGADGRKLVARASKWMASEKVSDPERMVATIAPGRK